MDIISYVIKETLKGNVETLLTSACNHKHPLFQTILIVLIEGGQPNLQLKLFAKAYLKEVKIERDLISVLRGPKTEHVFPFYNLIHHAN